MGGSGGSCRAVATPHFVRTSVQTVTAARGGCDIAFAALYEQLEQRVLRAAYRVIGDRHEAEDTLQDTFLDAYRSIGKLQDPAAFETWLLRIAHNRAIDRARDLARCRPSERAQDETTDSAPDLPRVLRRSGGEEPQPARLALLRATWDELPGEVREVVHLRYVVGLSYVEIARRTGISLACAKTRLHRARKRLREVVLDDAGTLRRE